MNPVSPVSLNHQDLNPGHEVAIKVTDLTIDHDEICHVTFDIGWKDSWRHENGNWDAAWVFAKVGFQSDGTAYEWSPLHVSSDPAQSSAPEGAVIVPVEDEMGAFIYRGPSNTGVGDVDFKGVQMCIQSADLPSGKYVIAVTGLRMVHIPKGPFWAGDPHEPAEWATSSFFDSSTSSNATNRAYQVVSENAIEVTASPGGEKALYYDQSGFAGDGKGPIPVEFPKGYDAFYIMMSPVTQGDYARFLNQISGTDVALRYPWGGAGDYRFTVWSTQVNPTIATRPRRPCNWLSWADGTAYACWAGLRPMTELEYEKACRGPEPPVANEYSWGNGNCEVVNVIIGDESVGNEVACGNCNIDNSNNELHGGDGGSGPIRADAFQSWNSPAGQHLYMGQHLGFTITEAGLKRDEDPDHPRDWIGETYYGVLSMTGNVWDLCVTVGNPSGRGFTGKHGDGVLENGVARAEVLGWPDCDALGSGYRGGSWYTPKVKGLLADRSDAAGWPHYAYRTQDTGFRCVRTAPASDGPETGAETS